MAWTNESGLRIEFGPELAAPVKVGEYSGVNGKHVVAVDISATGLPAVAANSVVISYDDALPKGAVITALSIVRTQDFNAGTGTLNVGITDKDGGSTLTDVDALVAAATVAELNADDTSAYAGVLVTAPMAPLEKAAYLTWEVDVAALTGGIAKLLVEYYIADKAADTLGA